MESVARILKSKPDQSVYTIAPTASVFDAMKLMSREEHRRIGGNRRR